LTSAFSGAHNAPNISSRISVADEHGEPVDLKIVPDDPAPQPISIYVALSAAFGAALLPLYIKEIQGIYRQPGFYGLRVEGPADFGQVESNGVTTLAIVVDTGKDRGQALACACAKAEVTKWWEDRMQKKVPGAK